MADEVLGAFRAEHRARLARLYEASGAAGFGVTADRFERALLHIASKRPGQDDAARTASLLDALHLEDLALAIACADGGELAWETFERRYRPELRRAAVAMAGPGRGIELADSLLGELFGLTERQGRRRSLFAYYHGRSRLATWLRTVLAQKHVDALRATRRLTSLDGHPVEQLLADAAGGEGPDPDRPRFVGALQRAFDAAVDALPVSDRLRLQLYYEQELTLAQIGRVLGEHEATVSRKLQRVRAALRREIESGLADREGLDRAQIQLCYEYAAADGLDLSALAVPGTPEEGGGV